MFKNFDGRAGTKKLIFILNCLQTELGNESMAPQERKNDLAYYIYICDILYSDVQACIGSICTHTV